MRHFYRVLQSQPNLPLMTEIMRRQDELFATGGLAKEVPVDARKMALAVMQVTNGTALIATALMRLEHDSKVPLPKPEFAHYLAVLQGQVICMIGEEAPAMNTGEVWWLKPEEAIVINKSGDDAILLYVVVKVD